MSNELTQKLQDKLAQLKANLRAYGSVAVGFSSGVDSTFLLAVAHETLGDQARAFTVASPFVPERDVAEARAFCEGRGIKHEIIHFDTLTIPGITANPKDRCYLCKHALFSHLKELARELGLKEVVDGSNVDDLDVYRPGERALKELGVKSPLLLAELTKADIRAISQAMGLPTADKPSFACLASRFPYGEPLTKEGLARVEQAENFLLKKGFRQIRVRAHENGMLARIELLPEDIGRLMAGNLREETEKYLQQIGFAYVALDLRGFRSGSMDEVIGEK